ncbi:MAG: hypothetical protein ACOXZK_09390 [Bacteroidales bacterium]|jgi:LEA14-like dessication related protein|nr:hypothetical protein [Bacteroidales bacterium]
MRKLNLFALMALLLMLIPSCNELKQLQNLSKCQFRLNSIEDIRLAGVKLQNVSDIKQISLLDVGKLTTAYVANSFPLSFKLNVDAKNPNDKPAAMTALDWILLIDDIQMTEGLVNNRYQIPAQGVTSIPMDFNFDLKKVLSGRSKDAIINFALNLAGVGDKPTRLTLKAKPTVNVGAIPITYPGYLSVKTNFTSK